MKKIAFLFLVLDNPHFPAIWDQYFKGHEKRYSIYIHSKYPEKTTWKKDRIIFCLKDTSWGFITRAYIELLREAYKDKDNVKFVTISESCLPITSFTKFYQHVTKDSFSWIKSMKVSKYNLEERIEKQKKQINRKINIPSMITKQYARFCLSRNHVKYLLENESKLEFFHQMHVGDDFFLSILFEKPSILKEIKDFAVTYDDWNYTKKILKSIKEKKRFLYEELEKQKITYYQIKQIKQKLELLDEEYNKKAGNPKTIYKVSTSDYNSMKICGSYFYRKFAKESDVEKYIDAFIL
jgi:hypothetical protein